MLAEGCVWQRRVIQGVLLSGGVLGNDSLRAHSLGHFKLLCQSSEQISKSIYQEKGQHNLLYKLTLHLEQEFSRKVMLLHYCQGYEAA